MVIPFKIWSDLIASTQSTQGCRSFYGEGAIDNRIMLIDLPKLLGIVFSKLLLVCMTTAFEVKQFIEDSYFLVLPIFFSTQCIYQEKKLLAFLM